MDSNYISWVDVLIVMAAALAVGPPLGSYIARVFTNRPAFGDRFFNPIERALFRVLGVSPRENMRLGEYLGGLLLVNLFVLVWIFVILFYQGQWFPQQPGFTPMTWDLAFHTAASFTTNTDYTHFSNESSITLWGGLLAIMLPFFTSAATGLAVGAAIARGFTRKDGTLGNVYVDLVRSISRILLPLSVLGAVVYIFMGVPDTLTAYVTAHPPGGPNFPIFLGPVAPWQSIELIGTNGGGFYGANAGSPLATPTMFVTLFGMILMMLLAFGFLFAFGYMIRRPAEAYPYVGTAVLVFAVALILFTWFESSGNLLAAGFRFDYPTDASFQLTSVYTNTGATNLTIGSLRPIPQLVLLFGMFTQSTPGGDGTGFATLFVNMVIAVFIGGLMVGRTPEYLGKKIGLSQVRWAAFVLLVHPAAILIPSAVAYLGGFATFPGGPPAPYCTSGTCIAAHNFTAVLYEFTSEAANNGSGYSPINDGTVFFNLMGAFVVLLGRFAPILGMLVIASRFSQQDVVAPGAGTLHTASATFTIYLVLILVVTTALLFLPVMALGPLSQLGS